MGRRRQKYFFFKMGHTNSPYNRNICHNINIDLLWESTGRTNVNFLEKKNLSGGFHKYASDARKLLWNMTMKSPLRSALAWPQVTSILFGYFIWFGIMIKITFRKIYIYHFIACRGLYRCKHLPRFMLIIIRLFTQRGTGLRWSPFSQMP